MAEEKRGGSRMLRSWKDWTVAECCISATSSEPRIADEITERL